MSAPDGPEERTFALEEQLNSAMDRDDRDAERADESRGSFADSIFELAKSSTAAYQAAYREGYNAGYSAAVQAAVSIIDRKVTK